MKKSDRCEVVFSNKRVIATFAGNTFFDQQIIEDDFFVTFENLQKELKTRNLSLKACGQCQYFGYSSMAHQMSGGEKGYCTIAKGLSINMDDVVHILDSCDAFDYRSRETESSPWLPA